MPENLPELNIFEQNVISKVRFNKCIVKLKKYSQTGSHYGWKGHILCKKQDPLPILSILPPTAEIFLESVHVVMIDCPQIAALHRTAASVVTVRYF